MKLERPASLRKDNCRFNSTEKLIHRDGDSFHQTCQSPSFRASDGKYKFAAVCVTRREIYTSRVVAISAFDTRCRENDRNGCTDDVENQNEIKKKKKKKAKTHHVTVHRRLRDRL